MKLNKPTYLIYSYGGSLIVGGLACLATHYGLDYLVSKFSLSPPEPMLRFLVEWNAAFIGWGISRAYLERILEKYVITKDQKN
jgi:hypothetical protein